MMGIVLWAAPEKGRWTVELSVMNAAGVRFVCAQVVRLAETHGVEELVLGWPKNMNATLGDRAQLCEALGQRLREETGLPVTLWDERRTTVEAHQILSENGRRGKKRKNTVDAVAATLILEGFLTYRRLHPKD